MLPRQIQESQGGGVNDCPQTSGPTSHRPGYLVSTGIGFADRQFFLTFDDGPSGVNGETDDTVKMLDAVGLGLSLWQGEYEGTETLWLRWTDREGRLIPTGAEWARQERQRAEESARQADQERQRADQERQRADQERQRATEAEQRAERLAARLRELGIEPPA